MCILMCRLAQAAGVCKMISMVLFALFSIVGNIRWLTNTGNIVTITSQLANHSMWPGRAETAHTNQAYENHDHGTSLLIILLFIF